MRGVVAHWKMNDNAASATVVDETGNYNGTYKNKDGNLNTSTGASTGMVGGALSFDGPQADGGTDEYIDTEDPFESTFQGSFSISVWVKPTDGRPPHSGYIVGVSTASEEDCVWITHGNNGTITARYTSNGNASDYYSSEIPFTDGQQDWHHIVLVADSTINNIGGLKLYFDGTLLLPLHPTLFRGNTADVVFADFASTSNLYIGAENYAVNTNEYCGLIDNVILFERALDAREIYRQYILYRTSRGRSRDRFDWKNW